MRDLYVKLQLDVICCDEIREDHFTVLGDTNIPPAQNACSSSVVSLITLTVTCESGTDSITTVTSGFKDTCLISHKYSVSHYLTNRQFFNNFTTNEDIATKFEADLPHCVDGFGSLVVSILATGTRVRGFKHGRSRCLPSEGK